MTEQLPDHSQRGHSPLGASGAERWMNCPGSVALLRLLDMDESDEPDYRREGTAMHEAAAHCLDNGLDTWEITGQTFNDTVIDDVMARHIQVYLDAVRQTIDTAEEYWVEVGLASPKTHSKMYGSLDFGAVATIPRAKPFHFVEVTDLKGGEGIIVEPEDNPQLKYYAYLLIDRHPEWDYKMEVRLRIVQPRGFHHEGPIREWWTTVGEIKAWVKEELVPAMNATELDNTLDAGPWCRFCPAKLVCPLMVSLAGAAAKHDPKLIVRLTDEMLGQSYRYKQAVQFYLKALEEETFKRLKAGRAIPQAKLVPKKANRVFKKGGPEEAQKRFGQDAMSPASLKSPAELEKLSPQAAAFVKEYAYMPDTGLTVALEEDNRPAVKVKSVRETFGAAIASLK